MKLISILDLEYLKWYQRYNFLADENIRILAEIVDRERERVEKSPQNNKKKRK